MTELIEKYLALSVSAIILVSLAGPIFEDGGTLVADCCRVVLVEVLLEEIDFGVSENLRTGQPYEGMVLIPSKLSVAREDSRLIVSFSAFRKSFVVSRHYPKPLRLNPPFADGYHLLRITSIDKNIVVSFRLM